MSETFTRHHKRGGCGIGIPGWKFMSAVLIVILMYYFGYSIIGFYTGPFWETLALIPFFGPALATVAMGINLILDFFITYVLVKVILFIPCRIV